MVGGPCGPGSAAECVTFAYRMKNITRLNIAEDAQFRPNMAFGCPSNHRNHRLAITTPLEADPMLSVRLQYPTGCKKWGFGGRTFFSYGGV